MLVAPQVVQKISRRVLRTLRQLGYLEAGLDAVGATGYDSLVDDAPELARTMAASVQQRIAFGERAGQQVRRIGAGFGQKARCQRSSALAVSASMAFRCTPIPMSPRTGGISWSA